MPCNCGGKSAAPKYRTTAQPNRTSLTRKPTGIYRAVSAGQTKDFPGTRGGELQALNWAATRGGYVEWIDKPEPESN